MSKTQKIILIILIVPIAIGTFLALTFLVASFFEIFLYAFVIGMVLGFLAWGIYGLWEWDELWWWIEKKINKINRSK